MPPCCGPSRATTACSARTRPSFEARRTPTRRARFRRRRKARRAMARLLASRVRVAVEACGGARIRLGADMEGRQEIPARARCRRQRIREHPHAERHLGAAACRLDSDRAAVGARRCLGRHGDSDVDRLDRTLALPCSSIPRQERVGNGARADRDEMAPRELHPDRTERPRVDGGRDRPLCPQNDPRALVVAASGVERDRRSSIGWKGAGGGNRLGRRVRRRGDGERRRRRRADGEKGDRAKECPERCSKHMCSTIHGETRVSRS